jgi:mRNA-degrading endonuclease RelE of RelBE toxin-antitoxin system
LAYSEAVVFVETAVFTRRVQEHLNDDHYAALQSFLAEHPDAGKIIKHSGGIRKLRWAGSGRGKRGGLRVIYYWWMAKDRISMLTVYAKNERDDLTAEQLKQLRSQLVL